MSMITWQQAVLCGIVYWLCIGNLPFSVVWTLQKPLVCGTLVGALLGSPLEGAAIGAMLTLVHLGFRSVGGSLSADLGLVGVLLTAYGVSTGMDIRITMLLSVPAGLLGRVIWYARLSVDGYFADKALEWIGQGHYKRLWLADIILPELFCAAISILPCAVLVYGAGTVAAVPDILEPFGVMPYLTFTGGLLIGCGILSALRDIFYGKARLFFLAGIVSTLIFRIPLIFIGMISVVLAGGWIFLSGRNSEDGDAREEKDTFPAERMLTPAALTKAWLVWELFPQTCYNYERMMGQHLALVFLSVLRFFYPDRPEEKKALMVREAQYFNTHVEFGSCVAGLALSLEERRMRSEFPDNSMIRNLKSMFMGSVAGIGDKLWQSTLLPCLLLISADEIIHYARGTGVVLCYVIAVLVLSFALSFAGFRLGYEYGENGILDLLEHPLKDKIMSGASGIACAVIGAGLAGFLPEITGGGMYTVITQIFH